MSQVKATTLKRAVTTGTLNLDKMSLGTIPSNVWKIYDIQFDDVKFDARSRITKIIISNNDLKVLDPQISNFPDLKVCHNKGWEEGGGFMISFSCRLEYISR